MAWRALAILLTCGLATPAAWPAQQQPAPAIKIVILEGEGAINNIRQRTAREPIVQVQDENNQPVAGAVVLFTLPDRGPSGVFANGTTSTTMTTDAQGLARATGLKPNGVEGQLTIRVDASHQGARTSTVITMSNAPGAGAAAGSGKVVAILAIAGGAAAGGILAATRRGRSTTTPTPSATPASVTTVSAGTPTIGPPR